MVSPLSITRVLEEKKIPYLLTWVIGTGPTIQITYKHKHWASPLPQDDLDVPEFIQLLVANYNNLKKLAEEEG